MMLVIGFLIGGVVGAVGGVFVAALCVAAKRGDERPATGDE